MANISPIVLPRVLIVSRRCVRKNKFVDFVGEYHLELIVKYGAVPVIVPRVSGIHMLLESFEPIHGVLLCEGEDVDPSLYESSPGLSQEEVDEIHRVHASDTSIDKEKDSIELRLAKLCMERNIPLLGICRGSQILNVACGGTLYQDIGKELGKELLFAESRVRTTCHVDYENYDGHRHGVRVVEGTPLAHWFKSSLGESDEILVNSYHHQGVRKLAERFAPMAFSPDGLIEGFYDPVHGYDPEQGKFIVGLQFHPERMRLPYSDHDFDYPGCTRAYQEFVKSVIAYKRNKDYYKATTLVLQVGIKPLKRTLVIPRNSSSPSLAARIDNMQSNSGVSLSFQEEKRLKQIGVTVRNGCAYLDKLKQNDQETEIKVGEEDA